MALSAGQRIRDGVIAGAIAMLVMPLVQASARLAAGVPMAPDLLGPLALRLAHVPAPSGVSAAWYLQAKLSIFAGLLLAQLIAGSLIGGAARSWLAPRSVSPHCGPSPWINGLGLGLVMWFATGLMILPAAGQGVFGIRAPVGAVALNLALLVGFALFGLTAVATLRVIADASEAAILSGRGAGRGNATSGTDRKVRPGRKLA